VITKVSPGATTTGVVSLGSTPSLFRVKVTEVTGTGVGEGGGTGVGLGAGGGGEGVNFFASDGKGAKNIKQTRILSILSFFINSF
jgi:hypothetical protein